MVGGAQDNPARQLAAVWRAFTAVAAEWAERTSEVTAEAYRKLTSDPAVLAVLQSWRAVAVWTWRDCECSCARSHPDDAGVCDNRAVITRRVAAGEDGAADVPLCAPCAVAQGVAEMPR